MALLTTPLSSHAETDYIDLKTYKTMLKLTLLTRPLSSHAETDFIDHNPIQSC
jgi:hypothetical protein